MNGAASMIEDILRVIQFGETVETWDCEGVPQLALSLLRIVLNTFQTTFLFRYQNVRIIYF